MVPESKLIHGLQLNRKPGEEIVLVINGTEVRIFVHELRRGNVTLRFVADPKKVAILRGERLKKEDK